MQLTLIQLRGGGSKLFNLPADDSKYLVAHVWKLHLSAVLQKREIKSTEFTHIYEIPFVEEIKSNRHVF